MANSYIGNEPLSNNGTRDYFAGDNSKTTFPLSSNPGGANGIIVAVCGVLQKPGVSYFVSGKSLTFSEAPPVPFDNETNNIEVVYLQRLGSQQSVRWVNAPIATNYGTGDVITASYNPVTTVLYDNLMLYVVMPTSNSTSTPAFSPDGLPPKTIVKNDGLPAIVGRLKDVVLLRFDAALDKWKIVNNLSGGAVGGGGDDVFYENSTTITSDYTISVGKNAGSFGPVIINPGVTITIPAGSTWSIV